MSTPSFQATEPPAVADQGRWFIENVHPHDSSLRAYLVASFPSVRDVDDVVQESYLRIWKARPNRPIECARAFLFRVARNVAINLLQRQKSNPVESLRDLSILPVEEGSRSAPTETCIREELNLLAQAIDSLPAR
ncbi:MAG: RNA polymerase sigma factor, partial [Opitutaceae bacterium]|nr:RNA polymerase sigma factor [Opitutaceae bacterium]